MQHLLAIFLIFHTFSFLWGDAPDATTTAANRSGHCGIHNPIVEWLVVKNNLESLYTRNFVATQLIINSSFDTAKMIWITNDLAEVWINFYNDKPRCKLVQKLRWLNVGRIWFNQSISRCLQTTLYNPFPSTIERITVNVSRLIVDYNRTRN